MVGLSLVYSELNERQHEPYGRFEHDYMAHANVKVTDAPDPRSLN
jgi:hypothetical protein